MKPVVIARSKKRKKPEPKTKAKKAKSKKAAAMDVDDDEAPARQPRRIVRQGSTAGKDLTFTDVSGKAPKVCDHSTAHVNCMLTSACCNSLRSRPIARGLVLHFLPIMKLSRMLFCSAPTSATTTTNTTLWSCIKRAADTACSLTTVVPVIWTAILMQARKNADTMGTLMIPSVGTMISTSRRHRRRKGSRSLSVLRYWCT